MALWTLALVFLLILWILRRMHTNFHIMAFFAPRIKTADGTPVENIVPTLPGNTIFGNTFDMAGLDFASTFKYMRNSAIKMKGNYVQYMAGKTILNVIDADIAEMILTDPKLITKGFIYEFIKPALGGGLLTSTDQKWHTRRKMLTPTFHFNILAQFHDIFKEESQKFVKQLQSINTDSVLLDEIIPKLTLNIICETALGVKLDECFNGDKYRSNIHAFEDSFTRRVLNPHLMIDFIYKTFEEYKYLPALKIVHEFSSNIIKKRRELFAEELKTNNTQKDEEFGFQKKPYAMLDTLLRAEKEGLIDHAGICEEVDTFIFGGFDTTSMGLSLSLLNLSLYAEMQERCYHEIVDNIDDLDNLNIAQLNNLKYMDLFIKESLRHYPVAPTIMRKAVQETKLPNGLILPANCNIYVHIYELLHNPNNFKNPHKFDPERFTAENSLGRHPYAFVPFSAGQRNCIGQKFGILEMKTVLAYVIKNFKILPLVDPSTLEFMSGIIIRAKNEIRVKLVKRI